ncbi:hypothetical protein ABZ135_37970 [Streptomyces sp. NPDC006339]|uniref:hypothetical protein n=1 Tax=Streptomyces sp. NPDC006339 TaxID=3156755 RepID=UPI0033BD89BF
MSTARRRLGTGPAITIPERDERTLSAAERAVEGDWVEVPERLERPAVVGRRPLGPRGYQPSLE